MTSKKSVLIAAVLLAVCAAAGVVIITLATRQTPSQPQPIAGKPPIPTTLVTPAAAQIRAAYKTWPNGTLSKMLQLSRQYPSDPEVQFTFGVALLWGGYGTEAGAALETAKRLGKDTQVEVNADSLLHPNYFPGDPPFRAATPDKLLTQGSLLQAQGKRHSAEAVWAKAAAAESNNPDAQVAAALGLWDKDNITPAFSHLGPLTAKFPKAQVVRFYIALLLVWTGQREPAIAQFKKTIALGPGTALGKESQAFVTKLSATPTTTQAGTTTTG